MGDNPQHPLIISVLRSAYYQTARNSWAWGKICPQSAKQPDSKPAGYAATKAANQQASPPASTLARPQDGKTDRQKGSRHASQQGSFKDSRPAGLVASWQGSEPASYPAAKAAGKQARKKVNIGSDIFPKQCLGGFCSPMGERYFTRQGELFLDSLWTRFRSPNGRRTSPKGTGRTITRRCSNSAVTGRNCARISGV
jgi:hypothetical protein